ncbi:sulfite exporter TauE/SafE family protein [Desulfurivibrio dismutans]|uniref:sulfite exporter TauE/SafE family protein n=1 Tax=Desulfurivibrio dismutans TaxID=1398908 RepID=UPI0023DA6F18|nr:sulfite exporter TauE/SafE family protein [Desulfurivibrio alkaliphilus]MDF1613395.1 sulfite exporter TauE/SafE family protein [Desulfurivibrio alkaliphilus]
MYFPTAGIEVSLWIPPLVALVISFFTSMGGVSGAFLLLPFQMSFLGYTTPSVSATNQLFNIVAIPGGVYRYFKEGRMVWPLVWVVVAGTLPGVLLGAVIRLSWLPDPDLFKLFAAAVLLYIGSRMVTDLLRPVPASAGQLSAEQRFQELVRKHRQKTSATPHDKHEPLPVVHVTHFNLKRLGYTFYGERFDIPFWGIFGLSLLVGVVGGIYGIGGGAIIAPFFVSVFGLPVYTVAGAALTGTFVTSVAGVAFYQLLAPFYPDLVVAPDWLLGLLFGLGGLAGMYLGARCQKLVPARAIKWLLCLILLFTAGKYGADFLFNL